jgi:choline dehydrogenase-like flavoprotein
MFLHRYCSSMDIVDRSEVDNLRIADGSIMPRVATGQTMGPCIVIGERAGTMLKVEHNCDPDGLEVRVPQFVETFPDSDSLRRR